MPDIEEIELGEPTTGKKLVNINPEESADLLDRLEYLSDFLPEDAKDFFNEHDLLLRMETLKQKLRGKKGVHISAQSVVL